ncbi:MAG TPA: 2OG-Fe(II) oxygenase, partial [Pseudohaliea sp.]|nr:2OG-Fe(II) oxygenase [Pseudohaliea sp.]
MPAQPAPAGRGDDALFTAIAEDLRARSCSIRHGALPEALAADLRAEVATLPGEAFHSAGVGRAGEHRRNRFVRSDAICWIRGASPAAAAWVGWTGRLREALNRQLLLGLFSFESHYACYGPG